MTENKARTILVVDDEPGLLRLMDQVLRDGGYQVVALSSSVDGVAYLREHPVDLVLLDILMPGMNGWETLEQIRHFSAVPVVFLTALGRPEEVVVGLSDGADDYIAKPFRVDELLARLAAVLRRAEKS